LLASGGLEPRGDGDSWLSKAWNAVPKFGLSSG
jgi:outer membrane protein assembly factor BamD